MGERSSRLAVAWDEPPAGSLYIRNAIVPTSLLGRSRPFGRLLRGAGGSRAGRGSPAPRPARGIREAAGRQRCAGAGGDARPRGGAREPGCAMAMAPGVPARARPRRIRHASAGRGRALRRKPGQALRRGGAGRPHPARPRAQRTAWCGTAGTLLAATATWSVDWPQRPSSSAWAGSGGSPAHRAAVASVLQRIGRGAGTRPAPAWWRCFRCRTCRPPGRRSGSRCRPVAGLPPESRPGDGRPACRPAVAARPVMAAPGACRGAARAVRRGRRGVRQRARSRTQHRPAVRPVAVPPGTHASRPRLPAGLNRGRGSWPGTGRHAVRAAGGRRLF